jgi:energy-coupling factor transporter transmembrane protein EcfT
MTTASTQDSHARESAEGQTSQPKTRRQLAMRIFKYLGLVVLVLLIIAALFFQAPWKVITLLLVILAACTILPRRIRRWSWLSLGAVIIALIIWIFLPEDNEGWQPYKYNFDKELKKLGKQSLIPPEENAAILYNQLIETYDPNDYYIFDSDPNTFYSIFGNPWLSKDYPEIAEGLRRSENTIETLTEISKIKQCKFPLSDTANSESQINRNAAIRHWARLLVIAINNDIAEGRANKAIQKIVANLQMAKHLYQQPTSIDFLAGTIVESLAIRNLNRIMVESAAMDRRMNIIENALADIKNDWNSIFAKNLEFDKLWTKFELTNYYEVNTKGRIRLSRDPWAQLRASGRELYQNAGVDINQINPNLVDFLYPSYLQKKLIKAETILRWFTMPSDPEKAADILDACLDKYDVMAQPDFDWGKQPQKLDSFDTRSNFNRHIFYKMHFARLTADKWAESNYTLYDAYLRILALRRGSRLLVAIKQYQMEHNAWPADLDVIKSAVPAEALIDPVTEREFTYMNHGERFSLYGETANIWPR